MAAGTASKGIGAFQNFADAAKARNLKQEADAAAAAAREEVEKILGTIETEALGVQKAPYELEREAALQQSAQMMEAAKESERGMGMAGRVQAANQEVQRDISMRQGQELQERQKAIIGERMKKGDQGLQVSYGDLAGAQLMSADQAQREAESTVQGFGAGTSALATGLGMIPLFKKDKRTKIFKELMESGYDLESEDFLKMATSAGVNIPEGKTIKDLFLADELGSFETADLKDLLDLVLLAKGAENLNDSTPFPMPKE